MVSRMLITGMTSWESAQRNKMITETKILAILGAGVQTYPCAKGRMGYYVQNADKAVFDRIVRAARESGATTVFERTVGQTDFALLEENGRFVRVSHIAKRGIVRVITTEEETLFTGYGDPDADGEVTMTLMNMDYSIQSSHDNGEGLIIKLADGSFIIYDGGYPVDVEKLLDYLEENTPKGQKPLIATWFLTHSHGDHYWGFEWLLKNEAFNRVELKNVMLAIPTKEQWSEGRSPEPFFTTKLSPMLEERGIPMIRPFAGQVIRYPGLDMEIMTTVEDLLPVRPWDDNTASSVTFLKFKKAGKTALIPGDGAGLGLNMLTDMYGDYLKCSVLQIPHHGCGGMTKEIVDYSDPEEVIFCTAQNKYLERIATDTCWNYYLLHHKHVRRAYFADHKYQRII